MHGSCVDLGGVESFDSGQGAGAMRLEMIVGDVDVYGIGCEGISVAIVNFAVIGETTFDYI
ncbi:hypothetical protein IEQ34_008650 [Dendrobium chrysotoxum]|uniref:Uncharacterized protein n=1 Tax=Dendrobium chrysotoxum TaxID=161865 RepID=A0AAV7H0U2_DENCH|nr:hypothetical protein IEQ34_008650 [Dendrobium chrysotoxum]